jgi:hypothetical protein
MKWYKIEVRPDKATCHTETVEANDEMINKRCEEEVDEYKRLSLEGLEYNGEPFQYELSEEDKVNIQEELDEYVRIDKSDKPGECYFVTLCEDNVVLYISDPFLYETGRTVDTLTNYLDLDDLVHDIEEKLNYSDREIE